MTGFTHNSASLSSSLHSRYSQGVLPVGLSAEQLSQWRVSINKSLNPVMVLDSAFRPTLLNESLRVKLSDSTRREGAEQPPSLAWQLICDTASKVVAEAAKAPRNDFAEAFPINRRCYVALGSLLRGPGGQVLGAIVHLGDLTASGGRLQSAFSDGRSSSKPITDTEANGEFDQWATYRDQARKRMSKLSRRESQVVALVSDGLPNKSIAHVLEISVKTIEKHRANATRKLGVGSTAEMVRIAVIAGGKSPEAEVNRPGSAN